MIEITRIKNEQGENVGFRCYGHAGFARHGKDIVCAAVSALVLNTINSICFLYVVSLKSNKLSFPDKPAPKIQ